MTDEVQTDATKALADVKGAIASVGAADVKATAWYAHHLFWSGAIAGVIACVILYFVAKHYL